LILPLLGLFLSAATQVNLLLCVMLSFNLLRAVAFAGWLPWLSSLIPEPLRGSFLGRERTYLNLASVFALFISGAILLGSRNILSYTFVFTVSFIAGIASLHYLQRVPESPGADEQSRSGVIPTWRQVIRDLPFRRLLIFNIAVHLAWGAHFTFMIIYAREHLALTHGVILWLTAGAAITGTVAAELLGERADRIGSKPYLGAVCCWGSVQFLIWFLIATGGLEYPRIWAMSVIVAGGFFGVMYELAVIRLLLNIVGERAGKARYFALYVVLVSLTMGTVPVVWGMLFDGLQSMTFLIQGIRLDRFAILFGSELLLILGVAVSLTRVQEARSRSPTFVMYEVFVGMPARGLSLLLRRLR